MPTELESSSSKLLQLTTGSWKRTSRFYVLCNDRMYGDILIQKKYPGYLSKINIMCEI